MSGVYIADRLDLAAIASDLDLDSPALGRSKEEQAYRRWCLRHRLFVNPLNDLGPHPIAASDSLMLPSLTVGLEEKANALDHWALQPDEAGICLCPAPAL